MDSATYEIAAGSYETAGQASKQLKEMLKRLGADPMAVRRTMIAAYEAEMNVVIHAGSGTMKVALKPGQVDVAVLDQGPGIPDIELAMTEGYSTAPAAARELGFGAGMGLPNIRKNTDRLTVQSEPNKGTQLRFTVLLEPHEATAAQPNSVLLHAYKCRLSLRCVHACPVKAIRVRGQCPSILNHLCIDCTACQAGCPVRVFDMDHVKSSIEYEAGMVLLMPPALLEQFGPGVSRLEVFSALSQQGFETVYLSTPWENTLREAARQYARQHPKLRPVVSPVCPAVLNLIQMRFPSLLGHIAPFLSPMEAACESLELAHIVGVPACSAHVTQFKASNAMSKIDVLSPRALQNAILPLVRGLGRDDTNPMQISNPGDILEVSGIHAVLSFLDHAENGLMGDVGLVELYACPQGCFGAPVWNADPYAARFRFEHSSNAPITPENHPTAIRRIAELRPRSGIRLDPDMRKAMLKLARIDQLTKQLPGRDCGACGAPTCAALAEDIVLDRGEARDCPYLPENAVLE